MEKVDPKDLKDAIRAAVICDSALDRYERNHDFTIKVMRKIHEIAVELVKIQHGADPPNDMEKYDIEQSSKAVNQITNLYMDNLRYEQAGLESMSERLERFVTTVVEVVKEELGSTIFKEGIAKTERAAEAISRIINDLNEGEDSETVRA